MVKVLGNGTALVETRGVRRIVSLELVEEEVLEGDYVLVHAGFAIQKLLKEDAEESLRLLSSVEGASPDRLSQ